MNSLSSLTGNDGVQDETERITGWLSALTLQGEVDNVGKEKVEPITPPRQQYRKQQRYDEVSPTDTRFSETSVFDTPHRREKFSSPSPDDRLHDNISDITSQDGDDRQYTSYKRPHNPISKLSFLRTANLDTHDSDSGIEEQHVLETCAPSLQNPCKPRLVAILSCMQCTLLTLPCSRTMPACTRCTRAAAPSTCLLLRRSFVEEVNISPSKPCAVPVLLKLRNEDLEIWKIKMQVRDGLVEQWQASLDRANWVLPRIDKEKRGNYRVGRYVPLRAHLGEGWGRIRYEQLIVDEEMILA